MKVEIKAHLDYRVDPGTVALLQIEAASLPDQRILETTTEFRATKDFRRVPAEENVGERSWVRCEGNLRCDYHARVEIDRAAPDIRALAQTPLPELPGEVVKYLVGSRFVVPELFEAFVEKEFAGLKGGALAIAVRDWVPASLDYVPGSSDAKTTATDTFAQRQGICRDYAHLTVALLRAGGIPARVVAAYAPTVEPPDFHAVAEAYLEGGWHLLDSTGMAGPENLVRIGVGRDAADIAFLTVHGASELLRQSVSVREI